MLPESPFETAARKAGERGACPVWELEDFYANHWDFESLCSDFCCRKCVAEPEALGPTEPRSPGTETSADDIPL